MKIKTDAIVQSGYGTPEKVNADGFRPLKNNIKTTEK